MAKILAFIVGFIIGLYVSPADVSLFDTFIYALGFGLFLRIIFSLGMYFWRGYHHRQRFLAE